MRHNPEIDGRIVWERLTILRVDNLIVESGHDVGVNVSDSSGGLQFSSKKLGFDAVVLAVGHSARDVYRMLLSHNLELVPKDFDAQPDWVVSVD
uniref:uncharacterized protein LOC122605701 isoform X2 n=1 Tax=Erigeron canadensis TaxID=72917 RepID=UPI001CB9247A|nr:uncharacterized protein LOC122605701 isoform X2 [Erigeron canadensis]